MRGNGVNFTKIAAIHMLTLAFHLLTARLSLVAVARRTSALYIGQEVRVLLVTLATPPRQ